MVYEPPIRVALALDSCQQDAFAVAVRTIITVTTALPSVVVHITFQRRINALAVNRSCPLIKDWFTQGLPSCLRRRQRGRIGRRHWLRTTADTSRTFRQHANIETLSLARAF